MIVSTLKTDWRSSYKKILHSPTFNLSESEPIDLSMKNDQSDEQIGANIEKITGSSVLYRLDTYKPELKLLAPFAHTPLTYCICQNENNGSEYFINPTTGKRCKKSYKNITLQKRYITFSAFFYFYLIAFIT